MAGRESRNVIERRLSLVPQWRGLVTRCLKRANTRSAVRIRL